MLVNEKKYVYSICLTFCTMSVIAVFVLSQAYPPQEMTRLRNSLIIDIGKKGDFTWEPDNTPEGFLKERSQNIPLEISGWLSSMPEENSWGTVLTIANGLRHKKLIGGGLQTDTVSTFQLILKEGRGYCADFTQVMNALCYASNIPVREWGISFDGYGGWGHAFSEVFVKEFSKWVFMDVFHGFYVSNKENKLLSVLEFKESIINTPDDIIIHRLHGNYLFQTDKKAIDYYQRGIKELYLWWGNNSISYDENPLVSTAAKINRPLEQFVGIIIGSHPRIRVMPLTENLSQRKKIIRLKYMLYTAVITEMLLGIVLCVLIVRYSTLKRLLNAPQKNNSLSY